MTDSTNLMSKHFINFSAKGLQSTVAKPAFIGKSLRMFFMIEGYSAGGVVISLREIEIPYNTSKRERN